MEKVHIISIFDILLMEANPSDGGYTIILKEGKGRWYTEHFRADYTGLHGVFVKLP